MKYKVLINGQHYKVSMSDVTDYIIKEDKDIIIYTVDLENQVIHARIQNPSQHTLYLISQGRCRITINCKNFIGHSAVGYHYFIPPWQSETGHGVAHSSGLGRNSYRFHKNWSLCLWRNSLLNADNPIKVVDINCIDIPYHFQESNYIWDFHNIMGYTLMQFCSDTYENPYRDEFYFDIRLALCSDQTPQRWLDGGGTDNALHRVYQTNTKITRLTFTRL